MQRERIKALEGRVAEADWALVLMAKGDLDGRHREIRKRT